MIKQQLIQKLKNIQVLRDVDFMISSKNWSNPYHDYILKNNQFRYKPVSYYFNRKQVNLGKDHDKDANTLAYIAYNLNRENLQYINQYEQTQNQSIKNSLQNTINSNEDIIINYVQELNSMIQKGFQLTPEGIVNFMVSNEILSKKDSNCDVNYIYINQIKQQFENKVSFMSLQNLTEAIEVLIQNSGIDQNIKLQLVKLCLNELITRKIKYQQVSFCGNSTYKFDQLQMNDNNVLSEILQKLQSFYQNIQYGGKIFILSQKMIEFLKVIVFKRFLHREYRVLEEINSDFDYDPINQKQHLFSILQQVEGWNIELKPLCENVRLKMI